MKINAIIPKKVSKHSQGSVKRPKRHKAYFDLKPQEWDREKDHQIKCKPPAARLGKSFGFEKTLYQLQGDKPPKSGLYRKGMLTKRLLPKPLIGN